jgi:hypothetical protein
MWKDLRNNIRKSTHAFSQCKDSPIVPLRFGSNHCPWVRTWLPLRVISDELSSWKPIPNTFSTPWVDSYSRFALFSTFDHSNRFVPTPFSLFTAFCPPERATLHRFPFHRLLGTDAIILPSTGPVDCNNRYVFYTILVIIFPFCCAIAEGRKFQTHKRITFTTHHLCNYIIEIPLNIAVVIYTCLS